MILSSLHSFFNHRSHFLCRLFLPALLDRMMNVKNYGESPAWMTSPAQSENSSYSGSVVSPGNWNVASPHSENGSYYLSPPGSSVHEGSQSPCSTVFTNDYIGLPNKLGKEHKIEIELEAIDIRRRMIAKEKALKRLDTALVGSSSQGTPCSSTGICPDVDDNGLAVRMQAIRDYKEWKHQVKFEAMTGVSPGQKPIVRTLPRALAEAGKEKMATSTRKKVVSKTAREDYFRDFKTVLDIQRERDAQSQALSLLKGPGSAAFQ